MRVLSSSERQSEGVVFLYDRSSSSVCIIQDVPHQVLTVLGYLSWADRTVTDSEKAVQSPNIHIVGERSLVIGCEGETQGRMGDIPDAQIYRAKRGRKRRPDVHASCLGCMSLPGLD